MTDTTLPDQFLLDVDIRIIDQRIGMGIGGFDTVLRAYHKPTGILVEVPTRLIGNSYKARTVALDMIRYALTETPYEKY
jgi:hypothetical protein